MKNAIEQLKTKKLAKNIAGVTLGAFALGMASISPVYAAGELYHGKLDGNTYIGTYDSSGSYSVVIRDDLTPPGDDLKKDMSIYGRLHPSAGSDEIRSTLYAWKCDRPDVTGLKIWGLYAEDKPTGSLVTGGSNVSWNRSGIGIAKVGSITSMIGFEVNGKNGVAAEFTGLTANDVLITDKIQGVKISGATGNATTFRTNMTLTSVTGNADVHGLYATSEKNVTTEETQVAITDGQVNNVTAAKLFTDGITDDIKGEAKTTTLSLDGVTVTGKVTGVDNDAYKNAKADTTKVNITGGTVASEVTGAYLAVSFTGKGTAVAKDTTVTLNGATVNDNVYGVKSIAENITATNTAIIFTGNKSTVKGTVYGLSFAPTGPAQITSGTVLTVNNIGNKAGNIANFDTLNFVLPENIHPNNVMLELTADANTDLSKTTITTGTEKSVVDAQYVNLNEKDKVYLIQKTGTGSLKLKDGTVGGEVILVQNAVTTKKGTYALVDNDLVLNISEEEPDPPGPGPVPPGPVPPGPVPPGPVPPGPTPPDPSKDKADNLKNMTETLAASVALVNGGADFATEQAMSEAKTAAKEGTMQGATSMSPFAAFGGSSMKYKSGSHIDAKGWNAALGFAKEQGELTYGIAVEHGQANYDSYVNEVHGEGKNKYTGGVIFAELKKESGTHFDVSLRAGRAKSDYNANLSVLGVTTHTSYDTSATYLGFSLGGGKETKVSDAGTLDLYARYYFNRLNGAKTTANNSATPINIEFKDSNSSRIRLGTRFTQKMDERNKLYVGLAWQYEFAGKTSAVIDGVDAPSPSMKGHSAMAELGWKAKAGKNLDIDLGVNGWLGKQRGIAGNVGFKWSF